MPYPVCNQRLPVSLTLPVPAASPLQMQSARYIFPEALSHFSMYMAHEAGSRKYLTPH